MLFQHVVVFVFHNPCYEVIISIHDLVVAIRSGSNNLEVRVCQFLVDFFRYREVIRVGEIYQVVVRVVHLESHGT